MIRFMCGIIGTFRLKTRDPVNEQALRDGMTRMALRGPDGEGLYLDAGIGLGHRRLAVIDIEGGRQPWIDSATGAVLVFNGEIYNFKDLRHLLGQQGVTFKTASDTEVLLQAYLRWGPETLNRLSGMFAFAIYEPRLARVFLARDRIGIKPLFYSLKNNSLFFASSLPALRAFPEIDSTLDLVTASHYLTTVRTTFGAHTLFRDIRTLLPGEYLMAERGASAPEPRRYWDYPVVAEKDKPRPPMHEALDQVRTLVRQSVQEQLISDVPLGGFLSGGIDSSVLASLAHELSGGHYDAYSVGYDPDGYNEWPYIREATAFHQMACHEVHAREQDYPELWQWLIGQKGMPISTPNEIPLYQLAKALKQDFTVALSGEGADEIFGGYTRVQFAAYDYDRAQHEPPPLDAALSPLDQAIHNLYGRPYLLCRPDHFFLRASWIPFRLKHSLISPHAWEALHGDAALFAYYEQWFDQFATCSTMDAYLHIHARVNLEGLLARVDSSTMAASVETRVPFTDHRVAEYLFTLPDDYKIAWRDTAAKAQGQDLHIDDIDAQNLLKSKILLRDAFQDRVPASILNRPKMSFPVPILEWLGGSLKPLVTDILASSPLASRLFRKKTLEDLLAAAHVQTQAMALWPVVNLCLWQSTCGVKLP